MIIPERMLKEVEDQTKGKVSKIPEDLRNLFI